MTEYSNPGHSPGPPSPEYQGREYRDRNHRRRDAERGAVTAETAVIMPALVLLLAVVLAAAAAGMTVIRFEEAARASARAAARGETAAVAQQRAHEIAGENVSVRIAGDTERMTVTVSGSAPGILGQWTGWQLHANATAVTEGAKNADLGP